MALEIPRFLQTKQYTAKQTRALFLDAPLFQGVVNPGDLKVIQRAAGANMSVEVPAGAAWIKGAFNSRQGMYNVYNDATANPSISNNPAGNPRVDQIVLRVHDTVDGAGAQDAATIEVLQGTATAGAQITAPQSANYRAGAQSTVGMSLIVLADVLVANGAVSIGTANIVDRRPWARGASKLIDYVSGNLLPGASNASYSPIHASAVAARLECSGSPMEITVRANANLNASHSGLWITVMVDGSASQWNEVMVAPGSTSAGDVPCNARIPVQPAAGMHNFNIAYKIGGTAVPTFRAAGTTDKLTVEYREVVAQNASND